MIVEPRHAPDRFERSIAAIHELIAERGIGRHALFGEINEGTAFPDGTESMSGNVVAQDGRVYAFWTAWDDERGHPVFETWDEVIPEVRWLTNAEYVQARCEVGLDRPTSARSTPTRPTSSRHRRIR